MMIKAKVTIFDDETGRTFIEDQIIAPAHNYRPSSLAKCYEFKFSLNVLENPFVELIKQEETKEETNGNS